MLEPEPEASPEPVIAVPLLTVDRWTRNRPIAGRDADLLVAFSHVERLREKVRKLSRDEWMVAFNEWRVAPR